MDMNLNFMNIIPDREDPQDSARTAKAAQRPERNTIFTYWRSHQPGAEGACLKHLRFRGGRGEAWRPDAPFGRAEPMAPLRRQPVDNFRAGAIGLSTTLE
jgi:hypothetical protein